MEILLSCAARCRPDARLLRLSTADSDSNSCSWLASKDRCRRRLRIKHSRYSIETCAVLLVLLPSRSDCLFQENSQEAATQENPSGVLQKIAVITCCMHAAGATIQQRGVFSQDGAQEVQYLYKPVLVLPMDCFRLVPRVSLGIKAAFLSMILLPISTFPKKASMHKLPCISNRA